MASKVSINGDGNTQFSIACFNQFVNGAVLEQTMKAPILHGNGPSVTRLAISPLISRTVPQYLARTDVAYRP